MCINKCGPFLEKINNELSGRQDIKDGNLEKSEWRPADYLKKRFVERLNDYYDNKGVGIRVDVEDILFTDWIVGDDGSKSNTEFGLSGVQDVKIRIKQYLTRYGIYNERNEHELDQCVCPIVK